MEIISFFSLYPDTIKYFQIIEWNYLIIIIYNNVDYPLLLYLMSSCYHLSSYKQLLGEKTPFLKDRKDILYREYKFLYDILT